MGQKIEKLVTNVKSVINLFRLEKSKFSGGGRGIEKGRDGELYETHGGVWGGLRKTAATRKTKTCS